MTQVLPSAGNRQNFPQKLATGYTLAIFRAAGPSLLVPIPIQKTCNRSTSKHNGDDHHYDTMTFTALAQCCLIILTCILLLH